MSDAPSAQPRRLAVVGDSVVPPDERAATPSSPSEDGLREGPSLLAALDAGDEEAVKRWVAEYAPPSSLLVYALLAGAGFVGLIEWPALALTALAQFVVDRRLGGLEKLTDQLRHQHQD